MEVWEMDSVFFCFLFFESMYLCIIFISYYFVQSHDLG